MAAGTKGTDPTLDAQLKLMAAQTGLTVAQIQQIAEERGIKREELAQRGAIATEGFRVDREKIGLGREEMSLKDKQAKLAAALDALNIGSKEKIAGQSERAGLQSDLTRRPDVPLDIVARTAAANGDSALFNALAATKLQQREKAISSIIPELQKPQSGGEPAREKKFKAGLEAQFPGSYREALARAYPKPGQVVPAATPEPAPPSTVAPTGDTTNPLASTLLAAAGFSGATGSATSARPEMLPPGFVGPPGSSAMRIANQVGLTGNFVGNDPNTKANYFESPTGPRVGGAGDPSVGALAGAMTELLSGGRTKVSYPGGGYGITTSRVGPSGRSALQDYVDRETQDAGLILKPQFASNVPAPQGAGVPVAPPAFDFGALLAGNATSPVPNPTPQVTPTPVAAPAVNDAAIAQAAELERQRKLREALALQARNSQ